MPYVPLIPLDSAVVEVSDFGLLPPNALAATVPAAWIPDAAKIRPASIPTALALARATEHVILHGAWSKELAEASATMLEGLVAGALSFAWIDPGRLRSGELRAALEKGSGSDRFGLVRSVDGGVWGYMSGALVPILAGARQGRLSELQRLVSPLVTVRRGEIGSLLELLKTSFESGWSAKLPWMALVDRVLSRTTTRSPVDLSADVRSFGPFSLETIVDGQPRYTSRYVLGLAPGFVPRLARAVSSEEVALRDGEIVFASRSGEPIARVRQHAREELGNGLAFHLMEHIPSGVPDVDSVGRSKGLQANLKAHYMAARDRVTTLSEALYEDPMALSDIARVVARYAPELVGEAPSALFSPTHRQYCRVHGLEPHVRAADLAALVEAGDAYALSGAQAPVAASTRPTSVFVERLPGRGEDRVGELSQLGLALWIIFIGKARFSEGYRDANGELLIDTGSTDFPIVVSPVLDDWWRNDAEVKRVGRSLATVQRFVWSYRAALAGAPAGSPARLAQAAAEVFTARAMRSFGSSVDAVLRSGAGRTEVGSHLGHPLQLDGYGEMRLLTDPHRTARA